ncbi:MAG: SpoIIE family protein phosphatase [Calditerricola sp.]|nr:SpoIIE family protein phosphatase [Calditerricola sp.]
MTFRVGIVTVSDRCSRGEEQDRSGPMAAQWIREALGTESGVRVDEARFTWQGGDALLLCSDGLSSLVAEDDLSAILASAATASEAVDRLVSRANEAGGDDNITVVVLRNKGENRGEAR